MNSDWEDLGGFLEEGATSQALKNQQHSFNSFRHGSQVAFKHSRVLA